MADPTSVQDRHADSGNGSAAGAQAADLLIAHLEQIGVEYVFGVPGGAIEPLFNALSRSARRGRIRPVVARHESGAAFMADGYARESGRIGVCCATSGPGATNLITGVACAYDNGVPLLVITGQPPLPLHGRHALQESSCTGVNILGMFAHCCHFNSLVSHVNQLEIKLASALLRACEAPHGPSHLSIPVDVLRTGIASAVPAFPLQQKLRQRLDHAAIDGHAVDRLRRELEAARRVVMLIGGGCGEAVEAILGVAEAIGATIVTTPDGKGLISPHHHRLRGVFGFAGHGSAQAALQEPDVDLVLAIGTNLGEWNSGGWSEAVMNDRLIHIDASPQHLLHSPMARLQVRGRIATVFARLLADIKMGALSRTRALLPSGTTCQARPDAVDLQVDTVPIKPQRLMHELGQRCPPSTRFLADSGNSTAWAVHCLEIPDRRGCVAAGGENPSGDADRRRHHGGWLRVTANFAAMGWAIGGSIGTALANPGCPVVCLTGDGSLLMNGQEITVARAIGASVLFVILNDSALGMVKHGQRLAGAERIGFELPPVDFRLLAEAMGIPGYIIHSSADLAALDWTAIWNRRGPTLLDVRIDAEEVPPMKLRMQTLGAEKRR